MFLLIMSKYCFDNKYIYIYIYIFGLYNTIFIINNTYIYLYIYKYIFYFLFKEFIQK